MDPVPAVPMDATDRRLLSLMREDSRRSYADLGRLVNLSAPAVFERARKLERAGIIRRHTVDVDPLALGLGFCAFVRIATGGELPCDSLVPFLAGLPEVEECHAIAGEDSILAKVRTPSPLALEFLLQKLKQVPGVQRTVTTVVLQTHFERGLQPDRPSAEDSSSTISEENRRAPRRAKKEAADG